MLILSQSYYACFDGSPESEHVARRSENVIVLRMSTGLHAEIVVPKLFVYSFSNVKVAFHVSKKSNRVRQILIEKYTVVYTASIFKQECKFVLNIK